MAANAQASIAVGAGAACGLGQVGSIGVGQLVPAEVSAAETGTVVAGQQEMRSCSFECGPPRPVSELVRANAHAAWMCKPCENAKVALESAVRKGPG